MRHRRSGVKLNRTSSHRDAMFRNMVTSLFKHERIRTTDAKAKELRRWADHLVTLAKRGDLHARRQALALVREKEVVHKLFEEVQEKFGQRKGGYTRVIKLGHRPGDAAKISMIELVQEESAADKKKTAPKPKATPAPAPSAAAEKAESAAKAKDAAKAEDAAKAKDAAEAEDAAEADDKVDDAASPQAEASAEEPVEAAAADDAAEAPKAEDSEAKASPAEEEPPAEKASSDEEAISDEAEPEKKEE
jgi:large subunit ribosomal protein L17